MKKEKNILKIKENEISKFERFLSKSKIDKRISFKIHFERAFFSIIHFSEINY